MRTITLAVAIPLVVGILSSGSGLAAPEQDDPCRPKYAGAAFVANLTDIALTTSSLQLLSDNENPRLRRQLQGRLATAVADARRRVQDGPLMVEAIALPNLVEGLRRATIYLSDHRLDGGPGSPAVSAAQVLEDLQIVKGWVLKQPWASSVP